MIAPQQASTAERLANQLAKQGLAPARQGLDEDAVNQVMGLVGQRRQLVSELEHLQERRLEVAAQLKITDGRQKQVLEQVGDQLDRQVAGAENALKAIENLIAAQTGSASPAAPVASGQGFAYASVPPAAADPGISPRGGWTPGIAGWAMLALAAVAGMSYLRRIRRDTRDAIVQIRSELWDEMKKVSVGVDAIAVELERIGEGQRYVTKALTEKKEPAPRGGTS